LTKEKCIIGLATGDWHVGSQWGLCPQRFVTSYESEHRPNRAQSYLGECFEHMVSSLPRLDFIVSGGDMIDGTQPKSAGAYIWEPMPMFQARAAQVLFAPILAKLAKGGHVYAVQGTGYHDGDTCEWAEWLAEHIGAEVAGPHRARPWLLLDAGGITLDCAHRNSVMIRYRTTPLAREIEFALDRCARTGEQAPHGIIRHHSHGEYNTAGLGLHVACECPAWQLQSHYAQMSISPNRMYSAYIGSVLVRVYPNRLAEHRRPVEFEPLLYPHPKPAREVV